MNASAAMRASPRLLLVEATQFAASFAFLTAALWFWSSQGSTLAATLLPVALFGYAPLRLGWVLLRWTLETYRMTADSVVVHTGVLRRRERQLPWSAVVAVDEQAGLLFRLFRIRRLQLTQSDAVDGAVVFRALEAETAAEVRRHVRDHRKDALLAGASAATGTLYRTSWRELALMSIVNGRFALLAPPVLFAAWGLLEDVGVSTFVFELMRRLPPFGLALLSVAGFIVVGALATISRYQGFSARVTAEHSLVLSYGLVEKRERHIDLASIEGVVLRRSLMEQLLRRSRLAVLTFQGTDSVGASHVLPSLPDAVVRRIARAQFGAFVDDAVILPDRPPRLFRRLVSAVAILAPPIALGAWAIGAGVSVGLAVGASAVALAVVTGIARILVLGVDVGEAGTMRIERTLVTETETFVRVRSCHSVTSLHVGGAARPLLASLHLYAGGARHYVGVHCSAQSLDRVGEALARAEVSTAQRQRRLATSAESRS